MDRGKVTIFKEEEEDDSYVFVPSSNALPPDALFESNTNSLEWTILERFSRITQFYKSLAGKACINEI